MSLSSSSPVVFFWQKLAHYRVVWAETGTLLGGVMDGTTPVSSSLQLLCLICVSSIPNEPGWGQGTNSRYCAPCLHARSSASSKTGTSRSKTTGSWGARMREALW